MLRHNIVNVSEIVRENGLVMDNLWSIIPVRIIFLTNSTVLFKCLLFLNESDGFDYDCFIQAKGAKL